MQFFCRKTGNSWPFFRVSRANWAHIYVFGHEDSFDCPVWGQRAVEDVDPHSRKAWSNACLQSALCEAYRNALGCPRENRKNGYESQWFRLVGCFGACCAAGEGRCLLHGGGRGGCCLLRGGEGRYLLCGGVYWKKPTRRWMPREGAATRGVVHGKAGGPRQEVGL